MVNSCLVIENKGFLIKFYDFYMIFYDFYIDNPYILIISIKF